MIPQTAVRTVALENNTYSIGVLYELDDGSNLPGPTIHIDQLADDYPDCKVAY